MKNRKFYLAFSGSAVTNFPEYKRVHKSLKSIIKTIRKVNAVDAEHHVPSVFRLNRAGYVVTKKETE